MARSVAYAAVVGGILLAAASATARSDASGWAARGREIVELVRARFYKPAEAEAWSKRHEGYADGSKDFDDFARRTRAALAELKTSHTAYYTPDQPEHHGLRSVFARALEFDAAVESVGVDVAPGDFVRHVFVGGPAAKAGLRRGDKILTADGRAFHPIRSFEGKAGIPVALTVRRRAGEAPFAVSVTPRRIEPGREWLESQEKGAKVFERNGKKVAYMHLFSGGGDEPRDLVRDAVAGPFAKADALVLDFRDGWGGLGPEFVDLFNRTAPVLEQTGRDGVVGVYDPHWRKTLVVLVNGGSRSGKEAVARAIQRHKIGTIVGERTAGAVVAGRPFLLKGGGVLFLAVSDVRVDGERLEGVGVTPDVVAADDLPFADGADPQLERALAEAAK